MKMKKMCSRSLLVLCSIAAIAGITRSLVGMMYCCISIYMIHEKDESPPLLLVAAVRCWGARCRSHETPEPGQLDNSFFFFS
jgi:hypothetical protein